MEEMRRSEAKESEVNHRFVEHMQWWGLADCHIPHAQAAMAYPYAFAHTATCVSRPTFITGVIAVSSCHIERQHFICFNHLPA